MEAATDDRAVGAAVLGPARVRDVLVTPKQRALVAALALAGPNGTCIERLADAVWGDRPPQSVSSGTSAKPAIAPSVAKLSTSRTGRSAQTSTNSSL